jgi:uncharacterized membrane protein
MTHYNEVAGTRVDRIAALSDALFAIALTLTVLEIRIPGRQAIMTEHDLGAAMLQMAPRLLTYLLSFLTLGIFWIGQQVLLNHLHRTNRRLTWLLLGYLATIAILPVSTGLLADYITYRTAVILYWLNILAIGLVSLIAIRYARRAGLVQGRAGMEATSALRRRLVIGQVLYAFGAALCWIHTIWSIVFIVIVQGYFAFGPQRSRWSWYRRSSPARSSAPTANLASTIEANDDSSR